MQVEIVYVIVSSGREKRNAGEELRILKKKARKKEGRERL